MLVCVMQMIPTYIDREVEQTDDILHSETRGVFWLSEEEAAELEKDPKLNLSQGSQIDILKTILPPKMN